MCMLKLLHVKRDGSTFDISGLVEQVKWSGRKGSAARTLEVTLIDSSSSGLGRSNIDIEDGQSCVFYWKGNELFRGLIMSQQQSDKQTMPIKAYDLGVHFANSKDTFTYKNQTASQIFIDCCNRLQIPYNEVAETSYKVGELAKSKTTHFDVIQDGLSQTYKATGNRFFPIALNGKMNLLHRKNNVLQWVIETGVNLSSYTYKKSIEKVRTRIKLISNKDAVLAQKVNSELEERIGVFQEINTPKDDLNKAQLNELVNSMLDEKGQTDKSLTISGLGIPEIYTGIGVYVIIKELGIAQTFYVDQDTHTFKGRQHTMSLTLNWANDVE